MHTLFVRATWRGQWRALVVLAALVAVAVAAVVAMLTAAERSASSFERLRRVTNAASASIFYEDAEGAAATVAAARGTAGVAAAEPQTELFVRPAGTDLFPDYTLLSRAPLVAGSRVNVPVVVRGRLPADDRALEVALSEGLAADLGVTVGDELPLESMTEAWVEVAYTGGDAGTPDGPEVPARVVGIVRSPADFGRVLGVIHLSPAFVDRYGDAIQTYRRVEVVADEEGLTRLRRTFSSSGGWSAFGDDGSTDDALDTIATALRLLAAVAAIAGTATVGFAIARSTRSVMRDRDALTAMGATRRELIGAALLVVLPATVVGAVVGGVIGVALTPDVMVGLAARIEPASRRAAVDWPVVLGSVVGLAAFASATVVAVAARGARVAVARSRPPVGIVRLDRPVPVVLGLRQAFAGESALGGRTSRAALVVGVLGLAGVVAALTVSGSIERLRSDPFLFGSGGTARSVDSGESVEVLDRLMPRLAADRRVTALAGLHISFDARVEGQDVTLLAIDRRRGPLDASIVDGRMPRTRDEVALGPATLERAGAEVGEQVVMDGPDGEETYRVVGSILFPEGDFTFDDGAAMTVAGARPLVGDARETGAIHSILFDWGDGIDAARADRALAAEGFRVFSDGGVEPARVTNLGQVSELPKYLAVFLGVLALVTLGHALSVGSRRRVREQATLRALGMTSRAGASVVAVQAGALTIVAFVVGVPVGLLVGSRIWSRIAANAHVVVRTVLPGSWLVGLAVVVVAGAALVAVGPWLRTRRIRSAQALRAE
ncbi:MAG: FtsX-like permease family protein [Actinobacteria bacterium]|nr:FtsX-like permease family protein [Actinomycetota bacterium]